MDNLMPHMTGVEACKAMRQMGYTDDVIIDLTSNAFEQKIAEYMTQGSHSCWLTFSKHCATD